MSFEKKTSSEMLPLHITHHKKWLLGTPVAGHTGLQVLWGEGGVPFQAGPRGGAQHAPHPAIQKLAPAYSALNLYGPPKGPEFGPFGGKMFLGMPPT